MDMASAGIVNITDIRSRIVQGPPAYAAADFAAVRIDGWLIEPSLNQATRDGVSLRLRPQLVDLLLCLASRPGKVFRKDELLSQVWDGRWIAPSALSRCIAELRTALADNAHQPHIIETIPKRGYRLIAPVGPADGANAAPATAQAARVEAAAITGQGAEVEAAPGPAAPGSPETPHALWRLFRRLARRFTAPLDRCA